MHRIIDDNMGTRSSFHNAARAKETVI